MLRLLYLFLIGVFYLNPIYASKEVNDNQTMIEAEEEEDQLSNSRVKEFIDTAINSKTFALLPFELQALKKAKQKSEEIEKESIITRAKNKFTSFKHKIADKAAPLKNRMSKAKAALYSKLPVNRIARESAIISAMGGKGCVVGIIAGTPLDIALAVETGGLAPAVISATTCSIGAVIAATPSFFKAVFSGASDLYKAHKLRKEIAVNQEDLDKLRLRLQDATGSIIDDMNNEERSMHLEKILNLNRQVSSIEIYIKQMYDTIDSMKT